VTVKRLVIAIDCDDVLVHTTPFLVNAYNARYGTSVTLADTQDEYLPVWQAQPEVVNERWVGLLDAEGYRDLGPDRDEALVLHELAKYHELHLITARREEERVFTKEMLERELAGVFTSMEFVGWGGSKGEICARIGADVLIDDNVSHLRDAVAHGVPADGAILFGDYPWNATTDVFERCSDWTGVKAVIDILAQNSEGAYVSKL
jgi:5'(3')-deoxyribonucleotidase